MATSNPGRAAWPCRCLKYQAGKRIQPTRLTTAPAVFSYKPTRAKLLPPHRCCLVSMNFLFQGYWNNPSVCPIITAEVSTFMFLCFTHVQFVSPAERCWLKISQLLEINVKPVENICRNFIASPRANSSKCFITVGLKTDGLSVPSPV